MTRRTAMKSLTMKRVAMKPRRIVYCVLISALALSQSGCSDPHVYGSIGVSSGFGSYGGWGSGVRTSISVGGRIH